MKQVVVDVRGAASHDRDSPICGSSVPAMKQEVFPYVGFRLVHDDAWRVLVGSAWSPFVTQSTGANRLNDDPRIRSGLLGLRLVYDREDT